MGQRRNTAVGPWRYRAQHKVVNPDARYEMATIIVEQADMLDRHRNTRYQGGAYRVRLKNVPGMRTKTFLGESAWSNAARYAADASTKAGDWRWYPNL